MSHYNENQIDELKVVCAPQEIDTKKYRLIFPIFFLSFQKNYGKCEKIKQY